MTARWSWRHARSSYDPDGSRWIRGHAAFPTEFQRQVELERLPGLIDRTLTDSLSRHPGKRVRSPLGILDGGTTIAVHVRFDGA